MELIPSSEAARPTVTETFPNNLWNTMSQYRVNMSLPLVPIASQTNSVYESDQFSLYCPILPLYDRVYYYPLSHVYILLILFLLPFSPNPTWIPLLPHAYYMPYLLLIHFIILIVLGLLSLHPSSIQIFSSAPCSQGARGSLVIKELCYDLEGRGFETRWGKDFF
jgi:hypothetical protein